MPLAAAAAGIGVPDGENEMRVLTKLPMRLWGCVDSRDSFRNKTERTSAKQRDNGAVSIEEKF